MDQILATANEKAKTALLKDNKLLETAKQNAKDNLAQLLTRAGVKNVVFVDAPQTTTPTAAPNITPAIPAKTFEEAGCETCLLFFCPVFKKAMVQ